MPTSPEGIEKYSARLYTAFTKAGVPDVNARIFVGQARHETASFSSNVFFKNNNAYGMKVPSIRKSPYILGTGTAAPSNEGPTPYVRYASIEDSARDLVHWLQYHKANYAEINTPESYASYLKAKNYYGPTAEFYGRQIRIFFDEMKNWVLKNKKSVAGAIIATVFISIGIYIYIKRKSIAK